MSITGEMVGNGNFWHHPRFTISENLWVERDPVACPSSAKRRIQKLCKSFMNIVITKNKFYETIIKFY